MTLISRLTNASYNIALNIFDSISHAWESSVKPLVDGILSSDIGGIFITVAFYGVITFISLFALKIHLSRRKRKGLLKKAIMKSSLDGMKWDKFEMFVAQYYKEKGYRVIEHGGNQVDGGIDLLI